MEMLSRQGLENSDTVVLPELTNCKGLGPRKTQEESPSDRKGPLPLPMWGATLECSRLHSSDGSDDRASHGDVKELSGESFIQGFQCSLLD